MNPDYYKTFDKKTYKHELDRVHSMDDYKLETRYGKMSKDYKIKAFHEALRDAGRGEYVRKKIEKDYPELKAVTTEPTYTITHPEHGNMEFTAEGNNMRVRADNGECKGIGLKRARQIWIEKVNEGWTVVA
jgi:hypothetical protein